MVLSMSLEPAEVDVAGLAVPPPRLDGFEPAPAVGARGDVPAATPLPRLPAECQDHEREEHGEQEQLGTPPAPSPPPPPAAVNKNASSRAILGAVFSLPTAFATEGIAVGTYIMLSTLSDGGRKVLRERPGWIRKVDRELGRVGGEGRGQEA